MSRITVYCMGCKTGQAVENAEQAEDWAADHRHPEMYGANGMHWHVPKQSWITRLRIWLGL